MIYVFPFEKVRLYSEDFQQFEVASIPQLVENPLLKETLNKAWLTVPLCAQKHTSKYIT